MPDVPSSVVKLVETFDRNIDAYKNQQYNEPQVRREFIDPFFEALGWDVIHEDAIKIGGADKKIDSLVHKLCNLTPEETKIIEQGNGGQG